MSGYHRTPRRHGWSWTLLKCALLTAASTALGAGALYWLVHSVEAPWFIPAPVFEWLVEHLVRYALWIGGALGALAGLAGSVAVVVYDARKGRLTRVP